MPGPSRFRRSIDKSQRFYKAVAGSYGQSDPNTSPPHQPRVYTLTEKVDDAGEQHSPPPTPPLQPLPRPSSQPPPRPPLPGSEQTDQEHVPQACHGDQNAGYRPQLQRFPTMPQQSGGQWMSAPLQHASTIGAVPYHAAHSYTGNTYNPPFRLHEQPQNGNNVPFPNPTGFQSSERYGFQSDPYDGTQPNAYSQSEQTTGNMSGFSSSPNSVQGQIFETMSNQSGSSPINRTQYSHSSYQALNSASPSQGQPASLQEETPRGSCSQCARALSRDGICCFCQCIVCKSWLVSENGPCSKCPGPRGHISGKDRSSSLQSWGTDSFTRMM